MISQPYNAAFENITQRAVSSYLKSLSDCTPVSPGGENETGEQAQRHLHAFFQDLYENMYSQPELFGLSVAADASIAEDEPDAKEKKQQVKRLLDKSSKMITAGLELLMQFGIQGSLENGALSLEHYPALLKQTGVKKKFLNGLESTGLVISPSGERALVSHTRFSAMMPALQTLARCCATYADEWMGKFLFVTCDFRALSAYAPQAQDLYRAFKGAELELVSDLHAYFTSKDYQAEVNIHAPYDWNVKYQGNRKIKATPLFQVDYGERYLRPLRMQIKPASTNRLAELLPQQPQLLQDDFARRANVCRGDECNWCRNQKSLGPSVVVYNGETRTLCWYTNPDVHEFDENTVELIQQYEQMHAELLPEN